MITCLNSLSVDVNRKNKSFVSIEFVPEWLQLAPQNMTRYLSKMI